MKKVRLKITNDLKRGVGNIFLTIASLLFVFVSVESVVDMSKYIHDDMRIWYWILTVVFFAIGCFILASIEDTVVNELGYRRIEIMSMPNVKVMTRNEVLPIITTTDDSKQTKNKNKHKKYKQNK